MVHFSIARNNHKQIISGNKLCLSPNVLWETTNLHYGQSLFLNISAWSRTGAVPVADYPAYPDYGVADYSGAGGFGPPPGPRGDRRPIMVDENTEKPPEKVEKAIKTLRQYLTNGTVDQDGSTTLEGDDGTTTVKTTQVTTSTTTAVSNKTSVTSEVTTASPKAASEKPTQVK